MSEKVVFKGFHEISEMEVEMKGRIVKREKLHLKSAVAALVLDEKGRVALVSQFRPTAGVISKEIPAGLLDKNGLTPKEILIEELEEECEINRDDILSVSEEPIHTYYMVVGSSDATLDLYVARVKTQREQKKIVQDADVDFVEWVTLEEFENLIKQGQINDPKTLLAYYYAKDNQ